MEQTDRSEVFLHKPKIHKGLVLILLAALVTIACVCSTENLPSSITNLLGGKSTATSNSTSSNILLQDNFSDPNSGWEVSQFDAGTVGYRDGVYFVTSTESTKAMWGLAGRNFSDTSIEIAATQISGPANNNNDYGVMCRLNEDGNGYSFNISGDGFYSIQRMDNNAFTNLVEWTESDKINIGNATNTLKVICQGSTLTFFVNGAQLAQTTDATYTTGDIALSATTYEADATEVHFDNLLVTQP